MGFANPRPTLMEQYDMGFSRVQMSHVVYMKPWVMIDGRMLWTKRLMPSAKIIHGILFHGSMVPILYIASGSTKSRRRRMTVLIGIKLDWWSKDLSKDMELTMKIPSVLWSRLQLYI
jgi:hypothetical protein